MQVCCECEDIDETFTNLISSRPHRDAAAATGRTDSSRWERIVTVAQDRSRYSSKVHQLHLPYQLFAMRYH